MRGEPADGRSDLWALGVLLYEAVTGVLPFQGKTGFDVSSAILRESPAPLPPDVPAGLRATIQRCLAKEPGRRYQRAGEVGAVLEAAHWDEASVAAALPRRSGSRRGALGLAGVMALLLAAVAAALLAGRSRAPRIDSIAVLPLENLSRDPEQDYFADGMTEQLITDLSRIKALRVISRTSVMRYKGTRKPLPEIARELHVDAVVEGSVLRSGERVRITTQLIHAATDQHLWAESYDRDLRDVLTLQSEVARTIAGQIKVTLTPQEAERLGSRRPLDWEAHELYLRGRFFWNKATLEASIKAIQCFEEAIRKAPAYASAHAGLADTYIQLGYMSIWPPREAYPGAKAEAVQALRIDDAAAEAHTSLAMTKLLYDWEWPAAEREFKRAMELNPNLAQARHWHSHFLVAMGRFEESLKQSKDALTLDPLALSINGHLGWHYSYARQYDLAVEQLRKTVEMDQNQPVNHSFLSAAYTGSGMLAQAVEENLKARMSHVNLANRSLWSRLGSCC